MRRFARPLLFLLLVSGCGRTNLEPGPRDGGDGGPDRDSEPGVCVSDAMCDDGLFCNGSERCLDGLCAAGPPVVCDDGVDCTRDACSDADGLCVARPDHERCAPGEVCVVGLGCDGRACMIDEECADGVFCNGVERCIRGLCTGGVPESCDDGTACTDDLCDRAADRCVNRPVDRDGDSFPPIGCPGGSDCNDDDPRIRPGAPEVCRNTLDDDCDGRLDCADSECSGDPLCRCSMVETCDNGLDDDCDMATDCADSDCLGFPGCDCIPFEICDNGRDDDCNGLMDCADPACRLDPSCRCGPVEICDNGVDDDCNGARDCADPACAMDPSCLCGPFEICDNGVDDDCNGVMDCADPVCAMTPSCLCGPFEICGNGADDDCNGLADCADPICAMDPSCVCGPLEICGNGADDDCNGLMDCADPVCAPLPECTMMCDTRDLGSRVGMAAARGSTVGRTNALVPSCRRSSTAGEQAFLWRAPSAGTYTIDTNGSDYDTTLYVLSSCPGIELPGACDDDSGTGLDSLVTITVRAGQTIVIVVDGWATREGNYILNIAFGAPMEICDDFIDNDGDRLVDCLDPDCASHPACCVASPEVCTDMVDQDCDLLIDCADPDCASSPACCVPGPELCGNGRDDDCDLRIDCGDPDCTTDPACCVPIPEVCGDGRDQDCDLLVDCADPDCTGTPECCVPSPEVCDDMRDNDCDLRIDCGDSDCTSSPACCVPLPEVCSDGADQDCDLLVDCADPDCRLDPACRPCPDRDLGTALGRVASGTTVGTIDDTAPMTCAAAGGADELAFRWTAPFAGDFIIDTRGSAYDTVLYLLDGCGGPEVACDDDSGPGVQSEIRRTLRAGQSVIIVVDGFRASEGAFVLNIGGLIGGETNCSDGIDNDFDGDTDCADPDCAGSPSCP